MGVSSETKSITIVEEGKGVDFRVTYTERECSHEVYLTKSIGGGKEVPTKGSGETVVDLIRKNKKKYGLSITWLQHCSKLLPC